MELILDYNQLLRIVTTCYTDVSELRGLNMLTRKEKIEQVAKYKQALTQSSLAFVFRTTKMSTQEVDKIKTALKTQGCTVGFVKNTLARLAVQDTDKQALTQAFTGVSILAMLVDEDEDAHPRAVKVIFDLLKQYKGRLTLAAGVSHGRFMDTNALATFATTPSRAETLARFAFLLRYPSLAIADTMKQLGERHV